MLSVEELEVENHLRFEPDVDDLGELHWATVQISSGATYAFLRYDHGANEVQVFGDPRTADLSELAEALEVPISLLTPLDRSGSETWERPGQTE